ncbi:MAG: hypothetical protein QOF18_1845, partial [Frankiaceae bacterium]|nr:hypothetical protein [Frankiaceae bacterium]
MFETILAAAADLPSVAVAAGTVVISEGDPLLQLLVLESGAVAVSREDVPVATIDQPGAVFGELSVLLQAPA